MSDKETKADAPEKRGVGTIIREALAANKTNEEALEAVKAEMPDAKTSASTVSWYRNAMRKEGLKVPTARELKKARKEEGATGENDGDLYGATDDTAHTNPEAEVIEEAEGDPLEE